MIKINEAQNLGSAIDPKHEIEVLCGNCGYDVDEAELTADTCSDCGEALNLQQNTKIYATSLPAAGGSTLA
jgi:transcription initiation factor IIE alpha subunit|tara:strand:+ start:291 stop:503 length:213 start_codon:yes stop_codon:yes gene_type:complete